MLVDQIQVEEPGDAVERSARVRWRGGDFRLRLTVPAEVSAEDHRLAGQVADRVGLPLLTAFTNVRTMADPIVDWADLFGAGLSSVAHCLGGGVGRVVIPSSADYVSQGPCGSHPLLDPL